jgi:hypothetical protein
LIDFQEPLNGEEGEREVVRRRIERKKEERY